MTTTVGDLLARDLSKRIEEIIQLDQNDEASVHTELKEYVVTEGLRTQYRTILQQIADAPSDPHEGVGVWISGFFGSGKSAFAKNLGYVLANPTVLGEPAAKIFAAQAADRALADLIEYINTALPTDVIMFDVQKEQAVRDPTRQKITDIMYTVLLRFLDYATDYDIAELEIELEGEGRLGEFIRLCEQLHGQPWTRVRKGAQKISRASAVLHAMDPAIYPSPDAWAASLRTKSADITIPVLVARTFELMGRRRPGRGLAFIIDEVGHYVGRSGDKIEDLRAVVEEFGKQSKNRLLRRKAVAPVWIIVTAQERLEEIVSSIDDRRVELARLQDRFRHRIDLAPSDIREVASRRVLAKRPEAKTLLRRLFAAHQGQLNSACRLERTSLRTDVSEDEFIQFYPYLPHFVDLSIQVMAGIRLQPGAPRHYGGSNRTIIKQAYETLVSERTRLADRPVGALVTLDLIHELVEGNLSSERQKDISDIARYFAGNPQDRGWALRVAKALALMEYVRDLPRTEENIAAVLLDQVGQAAPRAEVKAALRRLEEAQFVRQTDQGWKLQTAQEKNWESERRGFEPKQRQRNEIKKEILEELLANDPRVRNYRYRDLATFPVGFSLDGIRLGDGGRIPIEILIADDAGLLSGLAETAQAESRKPENQEKLFWVFALNPEIDNLIAELYASREMVKKYEGLRAKGRITVAEQTSLSAEQEQASRFKGRLLEKMAEAVCQGIGYFRGVSRDGSTLGTTVAQVMHTFLAEAVPELYPKLEMGSRPLRGPEAEEILRAVNLSGLSQVFYGGNGGLGLVFRDQGNFLIDQSAPVAKEILDYLTLQRGRGEKVSGRDVEAKFQGTPYGWGLDLLRLVLATLLRAGAIEVTYGGRTLRDYKDPQARAPFAGPAAFRSATFAARESVGLKTLTEAARRFEELTGREVDVEANAMATVLKAWADNELGQLVPVLAQARAHHLPVQEELSTYEETLNAIRLADAEECVRTLAGQGRTLAEQAGRSQRIRAAMGQGAIDRIREARVVATQMRPVVLARNQDPDFETKLTALNGLLDSPALLEHLDELAELSEPVATEYRDLYSKLHRERSERAERLLDAVKARPEWVALSEALQASAAAPLTQRSCTSLQLPADEVVCQTCRATVGQMESDLLALDALQKDVIARVQAMGAPEKRLNRVQAAGFFPPELDSKQAVDAGIERLREHLHNLLDQGATIIVE